jgi:hypothetical protein
VIPSLPSLLGREGEGIGVRVAVARPGAIIKGSLRSGQVARGVVFFD